MPNPASGLPGVRFAATVFALAGACSALAADLTVTVENIKDDSGQVLVGVFDSPSGFLKEARFGKRIPASGRDAGGRIIVNFAGLQEGTYAVSAIHDKDGNQKLTMNLIGVPSEPLGFSGKGNPTFGPPAFNDAAFLLPANGAEISISVK
ncbi:DUF2141 domain-containing protein [Noviherbaspirillum sp.]|uniref:DUF2141 domain-containing protein n=1 Tax=Noviherbaspirillum sp. TaxID=1926288 RepID=UPI002FE290D5